MGLKVGPKFDLAARKVICCPRDVSVGCRHIDEEARRWHFVEHFLGKWYGPLTHVASRFRPNVSHTYIWVELGERPSRVVTFSRESSSLLPIGGVRVFSGVTSSPSVTAWRQTPAPPRTWAPRGIFPDAAKRALRQRMIGSPGGEHNKLAPKRGSSTPVRRRSFDGQGSP